MFSKYSKISKLDYLFHKSGPLKGKPRGYVLVEYSDENVRTVVSCILIALLVPSLPLYNTLVQPQQPQHVRPFMYSPGYELLLLFDQRVFVSLANAPSTLGRHQGTCLC